MYTWRPITGEIIRFDSALASESDINEFFARHRVIARGDIEDDSFHVEIAVTGRRKRVAILRTTEREGAQPEFAIVPGLTLAELVEAMDRELRKVEIDLGGQVAWGNIDLGEVDVAYEESATDVIDSDGGQGEVPEFPDGPMLAISRSTLAEVPSIAATIDRPVAAVKLGAARALICDVKMPERSSVFAPGFTIELSSDPSGVEPPVLSVCQEGVRRNWTWQGEFSILPWVKENEVAAAFAHEQLGAGAFVTRIAADVEADSDQLRNALLGPADQAARGIVEAVGLAPEVADALEGLLEARLVPEARVFHPQPFPERLQSTVAYEVAGDGVVAGPGFWRVYRRLFLDHPRILEIVASVQAGVGVLFFAAGMKKWHGRGAKFLMVAGAALAINAGTRIVLTQWIQAALENEGLAAHTDESGAQHEEHSDE